MSHHPWLVGWIINNLFLTVVESWKSQVKDLADLVSGKGLFPGSQTTILAL
jgi:hypothetical protein